MIKPTLALSNVFYPNFSIIIRYTVDANEGILSENENMINILRTQP